MSDADILAGNRVWGRTSAGWNHILPPLRLTSEEQAYFATAVAMLPNGARRALIMGVTQELYRLEWPSDMEIHAIDNSPDMIDRVWLGARDRAFLADWRAMPFESGSYDLVVCDGGLSMVPFPFGVSQVASEVSRVLRQGGTCVFRLYTPPQTPESSEAVLDDFRAGRIANLSELKLRLWAALQKRPEEGIAVRDVYLAIEPHIADREAAAAQIGWPVDHLNAIDTYQDAKDVYTLPSVSQVAGIFLSEGFRPAFHRQPSHSMGDRCPILAFTRP